MFLAINDEFYLCFLYNIMELTALPRPLAGFNGAASRQEGRGEKDYRGGKRGEGRERGKWGREEKTGSWGE